MFAKSSWKYKTRFWRFVQCLAYVSRKTAKFFRSFLDLQYYFLRTSGFAKARTAQEWYCRSIIADHWKETSECWILPFFLSIFPSSGNRSRVPWKLPYFRYNSSCSVAGCLARVPCKSVRIECNRNDTFKYFSVFMGLDMESRKRAELNHESQLKMTDSMKYHTD